MFGAALFYNNLPYFHKIKETTKVTFTKKSMWH